eukprot:TRINITY_DN24894_c0_g1_i1.p1 TRINITY_DN24894_c0_g1~~TRINITY_DN24894_c0_g1_i1.p1  ORF type:complete len:202 (+),score=34.25 TRINITY_DN24894_c0_g1_i1:73-678(+)
MLVRRLGYGCSRVQMRTASKMGWEYKAMGISYYEPTTIEVSSSEGLEDLRNNESHRKLVVVVHHSSDMTQLREDVVTVAEERMLAEYNNKTVYAFSNVSHDTTLPCSPVIDIYAKGKLVQRTLGCSLGPLQAIPHFAIQNKYEGSLDCEEIVPKNTYLTLPRNMYKKMFLKLGNISEKKVLGEIQKYQQEIKSYKVSGEWK